MSLSWREASVAIAAALLVVSSPPLRGQSVRGTVVDATSGAAVGTGFVVLLAADSTEVARALWSPDGQFSVRAPRGGSYRLRSERIGYRAFVSDLVNIPPGGTLEYQFSITALPIALGAVEVRGRNECRINPERAVETGLVWEEIRKVLAATAWGEEQNLYRFRRYSYTRELPRKRDKVNRETGRTLDGVATRPYASLSADQLAEYGYVVRQGDEVVYYVPDVHVMQHPSFLQNHCFYVVRDPGRRPGMVGLAFDPAFRPPVPEVSGVLWIDESTAELRTMEVAYTELPHLVEDENVGGTLEFMQLPTGSWIVQRWQIRTPDIRLVGSDDPAIRTRREKGVVRGFRDVGGEILAITARDGSVTYPATLAHVTGSIYDSTKGRRMTGVRVGIAGTDFWTRTDDGGEFHLALPLDGGYEVAVSHPWLDSIGYAAPEEPVELARGTSRSVSFAIPRATTMADRLCEQAGGVTGRRTLVGRVSDQRGEASRDAEVVATWQELVPDDDGSMTPERFETGSSTDDSGFYTLCGLPEGHPIELRAEHRRDRSRTASLVFPRTTGGQLLQAWDREPGYGYAQSHTAEHPIWKIDFRLDPDRERWAEVRVLSGVVTDRTTGDGLDGVTVRLNGRDTTVTRADGTFDIVGPEWEDGRNEVSLRRMGYRFWTQPIEIDKDQDRVSMSVMLAPTALELDPVVVAAERVARERYLQNQGFYDRQEIGLGHHIPPEKIDERRETAADFSSFLVGIPGVMILDLPEPLDGQVGKLLQIGHGSTTCTPRVFVDGIPHQYDGTVRQIEQKVWPETVAAIEIYRRGSEVPVEYFNAGTGCVILVWTRVGYLRQ